MKHKIILLFAALLCSVMAVAQEVSPETLAKRQKRKNLTVTEWNTDSKGRNRWMDHLTIYDEQGRKIEEIEYASYGQRERVVTTYGDNGLVAKEIVYNDRNKPVRIRKYEYNADGTKKKQYNYLPNGKLYSIKEYNYKFEE
ncbi:MAG: hypothetical protein IKA19_02650 [Muribaculaceae bacterium]|nr:hypothetical protein [Muribaculaceae bacterium]MBR1963586.1 hypothetical protein [Muribaculaceae bacterium]